MRYTYDEDDGSLSDATSTRRSARQSTRNTPFENGPTITSSGRQVRQPRTGEYGESLLSAPPLSTDELAPGYSDPEQIMSRGRSGRSTRSGTEDSEQPVTRGRPTRSGANGGSNLRKRAYDDIDGMSDEEEAEPSGDEWDSDKNEDDDIPDIEDADDDMSDGLDESDNEPQSLVVKLKVSPERLLQATSRHATPALLNGSALPPSTSDEMTKAGAPKCDTSALDQKPILTNGSIEAVSMQQKPSISPSVGPSSYPTPSSLSHLPTVKKPVMEAATMPVAAPLYGNGTSAVSSNGSGGDAAARLPVQPTMNGLQDGAAYHGVSHS